MRSVAVLGLLFAWTVAVASEKPTGDNLPARKVLFAQEEWYRTQPGKEQDFVGVLEKVKGAGGIGFGRFNPYRLVMTVVEKRKVKEIVDGRVVEKEVTEQKKVTREVHVGGKPELLAEYVGKRVKLVGKAVDMEVEGKQHHEIWPARIELATDSKEGRPKG
jgi:hypothetical protein